MHQPRQLFQWVLNRRGATIGHYHHNFAHRALSAENDALIISGFMRFVLLSPEAPTASAGLRTALEFCHAVSNLDRELINFGRFALGGANVFREMRSRPVFGLPCVTFVRCFRGDLINMALTPVLLRPRLEMRQRVALP